MNSDGNRLTYTVEEAASALGISMSCAYDCIKRGDLPALHLGRRIVTPVAALEQLLQRRATPTEQWLRTVALGGRSLPSTLVGGRWLASPTARHTSVRSSTLDVGMSA